MIHLSTDSKLAIWDVPGYFKWDTIVSTLRAFPELKRIVKDYDNFEITKEGDTFIIIHKSQIFTEVRGVCAFTEESISKLSQKDLHTLFYCALLDAWSEFLI